MLIKQHGTQTGAGYDGRLKIIKAGFSHCKLKFENSWDVFTDCVCVS